MRNYIVLVLFSLTTLVSTTSFVYADEKIHPEMIQIDGGQVTVYPSRNSEPKTVSVASFSIAKTETTVGEFELFLDDSGYELVDSGYGCVGVLGGKSYVTLANPGFQQDEDHPVVCVSWFDVKAYLKWLSNRTGEEYQLPTIAQWNLALIRGNSAENTAKSMSQGKCIQNIGDSKFSREFVSELDEGKRKYPFVGDADTEDNRTRHKELILTMFAQCSDEYVGTSPVEQFGPDNIGLHGMVGNVTEWVEDCYFDGRPTRTIKSPSGEDVCEPRATKGISFVSSLTLGSDFLPQFLHSTIGAIYGPSAYVGFRIVKSID